MINSSQVPTRRTNIAELKESRYFQLPKWLIYEEQYKKMSGEAKILYAIMRDRQDLSIKNNWVNKNGEVYIIYSRAEMMKDLNMSDKPITRCVKELKKYGLMEEERQGLSKPNLIFLCTVDYDSQWNRRKYDSRNVKSTIQEPEKLRPNDTNNKKTNFIETDKKRHTNTSASVTDICYSYQAYFNRKPTKAIKEQLECYLDKMQPELIERSFDIAYSKNKSWCYAKGVLKQWQADNIFTVNDYLKL